MKPYVHHMIGHTQYYTYIYPYVLNLVYIATLYIFTIGNVFIEPFFYLFVVSSAMVHCHQVRFGACWRHKYLTFNPLVYPIAVSLFPIMDNHWAKGIAVAVTVYFIAVSIKAYIKSHDVKVKALLDYKTFFIPDDLK